MANRVKTRLEALEARQRAEDRDRATRLSAVEWKLRAMLGRLGRGEDPGMPPENVRRVLEILGDVRRRAEAAGWRPPGG